MFRDLLLTGGIGFDVTSILTTEKAKNFVWLISALIHSKHLASLSTYIQLKKQLIIFVETEVVSTLVYQAEENGTEILMSILKHMIDQVHSQPNYIFTIEYFIKKLIDPGEDFSSDQKPVLKIDDFKNLFRIIGKDTVQALDSKNEIEYTIELQLFTKVLKLIAYYILDESTIEKQFKSS